VPKKDKSENYFRFNEEIYLNLKSEIRIPQWSVRWHVHLPGLATAIHQTSGLAEVDEETITAIPKNKKWGNS